ncbi:hypothetical protein BH10ACT1_BH10ACT1_42890 [soil metagenome]
MSTTRLLLVRHGRANAADRGIIGGIKGCSGLSDLGRRQAEALRDRLARTPHPVDVVWTSVLPRAIETAAIIAPALGGGVAQQDCELCELHPGECDGLTWPEWQERWGFDPFADREQPLSPDGESFLSFARRVIKALDALIEQHAGQSIALVVHGGVVWTTMMHLLGFDEESVSLGQLRFDPANTSLTEWHRNDDTGAWFLDRYNDAAHLEGLAP